MPQFFALALALTVFAMGVHSETSSAELRDVRRAAMLSFLRLPER
jgi:hypothetical protein